MIWAGWRGRERDEVRQESSDEALARLGSAINRPLPRRAAKSAQPRVIEDPSHGVAVRRGPRAAADEAPRR
jgi:hypothetical protein